MTDTRKSQPFARVLLHVGNLKKWVCCWVYILARHNVKSSCRRKKEKLIHLVCLALTNHSLTRLQGCELAEWFVPTREGEEEERHEGSEGKADGLEEDSGVD